MSTQEVYVMMICRGVQGCNDKKLQTSVFGVRLCTILLERRRAPTRLCYRDQETTHDFKVPNVRLQYV